MVPKDRQNSRIEKASFGTILFNMVPKVRASSLVFKLCFGTILFDMVPKATKGENMTKTFQDFKEEYLEELGSEAKEEYDEALKELKEEQRK